MGSPPLQQPALIHSYAIAPDGGKLSYYSVGSGPSVLVLHGAMTFALSHKELALALSPYYTVHIASRRGRGLSDPYPQNVTMINPLLLSGDVQQPPSELHLGHKSSKETYNPEFRAAVLATEISDLNTLIKDTGAIYLIACSSGAIISLQALLSASLASPITSLQKAIIFEPPVIFTGDDTQLLDMSQLQQFESDMARGDTTGALVTAMNIVQLGPAWVPRWLMKILTDMVSHSQEKAVRKQSEKGGEDHGNCTMKGLGSMLRSDFAVVEASMHSSESYESAAANVDILLLSGSRSPLYLRKAIATLDQVIKSATTITIDGVGHEVLCGPEMRGQPHKALEAIRNFLS